MHFLCITRSRVASDESIMHPSTNCIIRNLEVKNQRGDSGDAFMQNVQYFVCLLEGKAPRACILCLLVALVVPIIRASGARVAGDYLICDNLTPMFSLIQTGIISEFKYLFFGLTQGIKTL